MTTAIRSGSMHARYGERIGRLLDAATDGPIGGPPSPGWSIHAARLRPGRTAWATVVQRGPGPTELLTAEFYDLHVTPPADAVDTQAGPGVVRVFPDDDALPSLPPLLASIDDATVVRYRPGSRCTVRATMSGRDRWLKVFGDVVDRRRSVDAEARWLASTRGEIGFLVAEPDHVDVRTASEWQGAVPGVPIANSLRAAGASGVARRLGVALASLSSSSLVPARVSSREDQTARTLRGVRRVAGTVPHLADQLAARARRLADAGTALPVRCVRPIHGSPHEHQWLQDSDGRLGLVDFDRWAHGDSELDAATFLGELYFEHDLGDEFGELAEAIVAGYGDGGAPLDRRVLRWYLAHKLLAKVVRTTTALRVDGDVRAAGHLAAVDRVLGWS